MKCQKLWNLLIIFVLLFSYANLASAQKILYSSTFTGTEGKRPADWEVFATPADGFWYIQEGQFATGNGDDLIGQYSPDGYSYAIIKTANSSTWSNYSVECSVWSLQENGYILLVGRWTDKNNFYAGVIDTGTGRRILRIEKVVNGSRIVLGMVEHGKDGVNIPKVEAGLSAADAKPFKLYFFENKIALEFNKTIYITVEDNSLKNGSAGLGEWYNFCFFDNVVVSELVSAPFSVIMGESKSQAKTIKIEQQSSSGTGALSSKVYRISMGTNLSQNVAENLRNELINWGYTPVELLSKDGKYEVVLGAFLSENEAKGAKDIMAQEGLNPGAIIQESGKAAEAAMQKAAEPAKGITYRVLVKSFPSKQGATMLKDALENDGYYPVDVIESAGNFDVYIGRFSSEGDAKSLANDLVNDGYAFAKAMQEEEKKGALIAALPPIPLTTQTKEDIAIKLKDKSPDLTEAQIQTVSDILNRQQKAEKGILGSTEYTQLRGDYQRLDENLKRLIESLKKKEEQEKQTKIKVSQVIMEIDRAVDQKNLDVAKTKLAELKDIDPTNTIISLKEKRIAQLEKGGLEDVGELIRQEIETARNAAKEFEEESNYESAILQWKVIQQKASATSIDYQTAVREIGRLKALQVQIKESKEKEAQKQQKIIYGIAGAVVLLIIVAILFMIKTRKRDKELLKQVQELTMKPLMELAEGKLPKELQDLREQEKVIPAKASSSVIEEQEKEVVAPPPKVKPKSAKEQAREEKKKAAQPKAPLSSEPDLSFPSSLAEMFDEKPAAPPPKQASAPPKPAPPTPSPVQPKTFVKKEAEAKEEKTDQIEVPEEIETAEIHSVPTLNLDDISIDVEPPQTSKEEIPSEPVMVGMDVDDLLFSNKKGKEEAKQDEITSISIDDIQIKEQEPEIAEFNIPETMAQIDEPPIPDAFLEPKTFEEPKIFEVKKPEEKPKEQVVASKPKPDDETKVAGVTFEKQPSPVSQAKMQEKIDIPKPPQPKVSAPAAEMMDGIIFSQDFDSEPDGVKPQNWKGDYDFASLIVTNQNPAPNSTKCMKFEKKTGSGSAYYSYKFPDASGVLGVEFDLRCDNKNKYLLGFYIEKDEDFRQSIHTIIHRTDSNTEPSLRIQGQPTPYKLQEWCRIKYIINLLEGTVDGYVNDKLIANRIRLATRPKSINTLSIRDNLATTGILYIDNIKIYRI